MMVSINLLPEAYRKPRVSKVEQLHRSPLAILAVGALVGMAALGWMVLLMRQARLAQLTQRLQQLASQKTAAEELKASVQQLRDQHTVFQRLSRERSQWARRLNILSDVTPEGVWFTDLSLDQGKGLIVQGSAIGRGGEEMVRIGRLVQDLKADAAFSAVVQDIQIESIKSVQEKEIEVIEFTLTCKLADSPAREISR
jgi:Tfp pilus assembly protein PilN